DLETRGEYTLRLHPRFDPKQDILESRLLKAGNVVEHCVVKPGQYRPEQAFKCAEIHYPAVRVRFAPRNAGGHHEGMAVHPAIVRSTCGCFDIVAGFEGS